MYTRREWECLIINMHAREVVRQVHTKCKLLPCPPPRWTGVVLHTSHSHSGFPPVQPHSSALASARPLGGLLSLCPTPPRTSPQPPELKPWLPPTSGQQLCWCWPSPSSPVPLRRPPQRLPLGLPPPPFPPPCPLSTATALRCPCNPTAPLKSMLFRWPTGAPPPSPPQRISVRPPPPTLRLRAGQASPAAPPLRRSWGTAATATSECCLFSHVCCCQSMNPARLAHAQSCTPLTLTAWLPQCRAYLAALHSRGLNPEVAIGTTGIIAPAYGLAFNPSCA